jgi:hypothetical protein
MHAWPASARLLRMPLEAVFLRVMAVLQARRLEPSLGAEHDLAVAAQTLLARLP